MSGIKSDLAIDRDRAVVLLIDIQERLCPAMPAEVLSRVVRNACTLVEMARRFSLPVVVSQQYPRGLGATIGEIETALGGMESVHRFDKTTFGCAAAADFAPIREAVGIRRQWIAAGMETHVCVYQSARQLVEAGDAVQVVSDAVISRHKSNWRLGLSLCERAGAIVTSTEIVVFDGLQQAGGDDFKALSRRIR